MKVSTYLSTTLLMIAVGLSLRTAARADLYWDIDGPTNGSAGGATPAGTWDAISTNWNTDPTGGAGGGKTTWDGTTAVFSAANDATGAYTVTLDATQSAAGINFEEGAVTISGGTQLDLTGGAVDVATGASGSINSIVGGFSGLTKTGSGSLALGGTNVYSGTTNINAGILSANNASSLGAVDGTLVVSGASLEVSGSGVTISEPLTVGGSGSTGANGAIFKSGTGTTTLNGAITLTGDTLINGTAGTLNISGGITGTGNLTIGGAAAVTVPTAANGTLAPLAFDGTLTKEGTNTLSLAFANTYAGATIINGGIVSVSNATGLGPANSSTTTVNTGSTLQVSGGITINEKINLNGTGSTGTNGALRKTGNNTTAISGQLTGAGSIEVTAGTLRLTAQVSTGGDNAGFTGPINVVGTPTANSTLRFEFISPNQLGTGNVITLDYGTLRNDNGSVPGNGSMLNSSKTITLGAGGGTLEYNTAGGLSIVNATSVISGVGGLTKTGVGNIGVAAACTYEGPTHVVAGFLKVRTSNERFPNGSALTVDSGATFDVDGLTETMGSLAGDGTVELNGGTFTSGGDNTSTIFSGQITGTGTTTIVTKQGTGTLTLSGNNTYTQITSITGGVIKAQSNTALGAATIGTRISSGAALHIDGTGLAIDDPINMNGNGISSTGAVLNLANDNTLNGAFLLNGNSRIHSDGGTLTIAGGMGSATGNVADSSNRNLTLGGDGNIAISGVINTNGGTLTKTGAGTATLTGVNAYTGNTIVQAGTLSINNAYLADAADVLLTTGSIFNLNFSGTPDTIDELFIDSVGQATGTWGGPGSGATHINSLFSGTGMILVSTAPGGLPGDFDGDTDVDGFDFLKWQRGESPNPLSDSDFAAWKTNFGTPPPLTSIPEPGSGLMAVMGTANILAGLIVGNRRRRKLRTVTTP